MADNFSIEALKQEAHVIGPQQEYDALLNEIGDASIVLLGEATHGTEEFYRARARISQRLIEEKNFDAIAVEADWPDALRVSRYISETSGSNVKHDTAGDETPEDALQNFTRFPLWMWRNTETVDLIKWMRGHNMQPEGSGNKVGFFGIDLYSLRKSMDSVVRYLSKVDPDAEKQARIGYSCFDNLAENPQEYGYAASFGMKKDCAEEVVQQLVTLSENAGKYLSGDGMQAENELLYAQQNARVAQNAEAYYRTMFVGRNASWNLRDTHMADTLDALRDHLSQQRGRPAKIIVWAHNSHIGDARATEMGDHGQLNLGQLVRERYRPEETFLLGFTTHAGTVTAASEWDSPAELKEVRTSSPESYERLFHQTGLGNFFLPLRDGSQAAEVLNDRRLERAIGVIYLPGSERLSHYFHASIAKQFDGVVHFDITKALTPLDRTAHWRSEEMPETYPSGV